MNQRKRVIVAMSGGVDSSTVAAMLHEQGHEVIGLTMQLYDYSGMPQKKGTCCAGIDVYDAKSVADKLGFKHYVLNYESKFKQSVIDDFADSYLRGETPIPCVRCNQTVKFQDMLKMAAELGGDYLATGHYVKKVTNNGRSELHKAHDQGKDQSYFLFTTTRKQLDFLEFPLGSYTKDQTRKLAQKYGLDNADKPDSQDICFVPDGDYASLISKLRPGALDKGHIKNLAGEILGEHNGIINYTIGQRKGLGISHHSPLYVIKIDHKTNEVIVGEESDLSKTSFFIKEANWLTDETEPEKIYGQIKIRSTHKGCNAHISLYNKAQGIYKVETLEPQKSITPGQACVIYDNDRVLGGGWIEKIM